MDLYHFRCEEAFNSMNSSGFILDFLNSDVVRRVISEINTGRKEQIISSVSYKELKTSAVTMALFDKFSENSIIDSRGYISKVMPDYKDGIEICDKLRESFYMEESESYEIWSSEDRNEFLFRILMHLSLGGSVCQYEDFISPYLEMSKSLYKDLLTVEKDPATSELKIVSRVYQLFNNSSLALHSDEDHIQNFFYLIIDPRNRHVKVWQNRWRSFW
jgi:hypothetical protein